MIRLDPGSDSAHASMAQALVALGKPGAAISHFNLAIDKKPSHWPYYSMRSEACLRFERYGESEKDARKVIELAPEKPDGHRDLGRSEFELERIQDAIKSLLKAEQLSSGPEEHDPLTISMSFLRNGEASRAKPYWELALQLTPAIKEGPDSARQAGVYLSSRGERALKELLEKFPAP